MYAIYAEICSANNMTDKGLENVNDDIPDVYTHAAYDTFMKEFNVMPTGIDQYELEIITAMLDYAVYHADLYDCVTLDEMMTMLMNIVK
jgi:hypothetical protein